MILPKEGEGAWLRQLQIGGLRRRGAPVVVSSIQVGNWNSGQFVRRHIIKTGKIDRIKVTPARRASCAEWMDAALFAKQVLVGHGVKLLVAQPGFARQ